VLPGIFTLPMLLFALFCRKLFHFVVHVIVKERGQDIPGEKPDHIEYDKNNQYGS
jgi:hypothetical protein